MRRETDGRDEMSYDLYQTSSEPEVLRPPQAGEAVVEAAHSTALDQLVSPYSLDDRDRYILACRFGYEIDQRMSEAEIGLTCGRRFEAALTRQRVSQILQRLQGELSPETWATLDAHCPVKPRTAKSFKRLEGTLRRQARKLPANLNYSQIVGHFGLPIPPHRSRTGELLDGALALTALHEDFGVLEACGYRICPNCKIPRSVAECFWRQKGGFAVSWCRECTRNKVREWYRRTHNHK